MQTQYDSKQNPSFSGKQMCNSAQMTTLPKDVYAKFINSICDDDSSIKKIAKKAIQEVSRQDPRHYLDHMGEKLFNLSSFKTEEGLKCYIDLFRESYTFLDSSVLKEKSKTIYRTFKRLIISVNHFIIFVLRGICLQLGHETFP